MWKKVGQSSLLHNKLLFGHVIFIHTHTHRALLWKHPCKYLPPCLLCCYSSHPRIVFFFSFFLTHSLVFVTHSLQWKPQLDLSLIPPFSWHSLLYQRNSLSFWVISMCSCVPCKSACACERARTEGNSKQITNRRVTMVIANNRQRDLRVAR